MRREAEEWVRQAQEDMLAVHSNIREEKYSWACFIAQQAAEKALKALYADQHSEEPPHSHSLRMLAADGVPPGTEVPQEILEALAGLDRHYTISRYRSSLMAVPGEEYCKADAEEARRQCSKTLQWATALLREKGS